MVYLPANFEEENRPEAEKLYMTSKNSIIEYVFYVFCMTEGDENMFIGCVIEIRIW